MGPKEWEYLRHVVFPAVQNDGERDALLSLATAVDACELGGPFSADLATSLDTAVRAASSVVRAHGCRWLFRLAGQHPPAVDLLWRLFRSGSGATRLSIVQAVGFNDVDDEPLERAIVSAGLKDRLPKVRLCAADRAMAKQWRDMVAEVEAAEAALAAPDRARLQFPLGLLRDGYLVGRSDSDASHLTVHFAGGLTTVRVPPTVLDAVGAAEVARRIRLRREWPRPAPEPPGDSWDAVPDPLDASRNAGLDPDLVAARMVFAAFEESATAAAVTVQTLGRVLQGSSKVAVRCAAAWLVAIAKGSTHTADTVLRLFTASDGAARLAIMQAVHAEENLPVHFATAIVRHAIIDPTPLTRRLAGNKAQHAEHHSLLPVVIEASAADPDAETAASLAENVAFLRHGYIAAALPRKRYEVRVAIGRGTLRIEMPAKIVDEIGLSEIARRVRARRDHRGRRPKGRPWDPI